MARSTSPTFAKHATGRTVVGMAPFLRRKSPMEKLEHELAALRARAETLNSRHAAAEAAFSDAKAKLQRHHLEADLDADYKSRARLEAAVAACTLTRDGYADALAEVQTKIADAERKLAAERAAAERKAASEQLARDLDSIEQALPNYLHACRDLASALEAIHHSFEAAQMATFIHNGQAQIEIAAAFVVQELRNMVGAIRDGVAPVPAAKPDATFTPAPEPEPVPHLEPDLVLREGIFTVIDRSAEARTIQIEVGRI
ncbi:hypothetical protein ACVWYH_000885 [Bradyrhizobium sp. GM24.11]